MAHLMETFSFNGNYGIKIEIEAIHEFYWLILKVRKTYRQALDTTCE